MARNEASYVRLVTIPRTTGNDNALVIRERFFVDLIIHSLVVPFDLFSCTPIVLKFSRHHHLVYIVKSDALQFSFLVKCVLLFVTQRVDNTLCHPTMLSNTLYLASESMVLIAL